MRKIGVLICTKLPGLIERCAITPEIGAMHVGVGEFEVGQPVRGARVFQVVLDLVDVVGADQLLLGQLARTRVVGFELAHLRGGLRGLQRGARRIQAHQHLAGVHLLAFFGQHAQRDAGGLGDHLRFAARFQRRRAAVAGRDRAMGGRGHFHRNGFRPFRFLGLGVAFGPALAAAHRKGRADQRRAQQQGKHTPIGRRGRWNGWRRHVGTCCLVL